MQLKQCFERTVQLYVHILVKKKGRKSVVLQLKLAKSQTQGKYKEENTVNLKVEIVNKENIVNLEVEEFQFVEKNF